MSARDDVLAGVRAALRGVEPAAAIPAAPRQPPAPDRVARFVERVDDYRATVLRGDAADLARWLREALPPGARVVVPPGLPAHVVAALARVEPATVDDGLTAAALDTGFDAVVTTATVGIAETGTIVLDHGPGQGRRLLTLIPDRHVCLVTDDQIVDDVPDALSRLTPTRPQTWISGPSATSDIELDRVEGVHGPRTLVVVVLTSPPA